MLVVLLVTLCNINIIILRYQLLNLGLEDLARLVG